MAGHWANDSGSSAIWIIAPAIGIALDLTPGEVGLLIAVHSIGASIAYLPAGILADRVSNHGRLLQITFVWVALGYAAASFAPGFWTIALLLVIGGLGDAAWHPIATGVLVRLQPDRRAEALGLHALGGTLAEVTAPLAMGFLLAVVDWRAALLFAVLPAAVMAVAFTRVAGRVPRADGPRLSLADLGALMRRWRHRSGLTLIVTISVYNMANMAILAMMPLYLQQAHGWGPSETGIAFSVMILLGALAQPWTGRLSDRAGRKRVIVAGNFVAGVAAIAAWLMGADIVAVLFALGIAILALTAIRAPFLASAVDYAGEREATTLGMAFVFLDGVGAFGAWMAGLAANVELGSAFLLAGGLSIVAGLGALKLQFSRMDGAPV